LAVRKDFVLAPRLVSHPRRVQHIILQAYGPENSVQSPKIYQGE